MKPFAAPAVSIDGEIIKRLREEGRLTQLYVAKVVGVTTDTVSRWENNRYPTIRRDNALKLAEALDVPLERILRQEEAGGQEAVAQPATRRGKYYFSGFVVAGLIGLALLVWVQAGPEAPQQILLKGQRHVPRFTAPGTRVPIRLELDSQKKLKGLIIREEFPVGWVMVESDPPPASLDNLNGTVRWMLRNPNPAEVIVYVLKAPDNAKDGDSIELKGEVVANPDGQRFSTAITSTGPLEIAPLHWADMNGNFQIDDLEILEVSDLADESERIHYNWELIEKLWDAGAYSFDRKKHEFLPVKAATPTVPVAPPAN